MKFICIAVLASAALFGAAFPGLTLLPNGSSAGPLTFLDASGVNSVVLQAPTAVTSSFTMTLPAAGGTGCLSLGTPTGSVYPVQLTTCGGITNPLTVTKRLAWRHLALCVLAGLGVHRARYALRHHFRLGSRQHDCRGHP